MVKYLFALMAFVLVDFHQYAVAQPDGARQQPQQPQQPQAQPQPPDPPDRPYQPPPRPTPPAPLPPQPDAHPDNPPLPQGLTIVGERTAKRMANLSVSAFTQGVTYNWDLTTPKNFTDTQESELEVVDLTGRFLFAGPPGTYKVKLVVSTVSGTPPTIQQQTIRTTVRLTGGSEPPPGPGPGPNPNPPGPPADPFSRSLYDALRSDTSPTRNADMLTLVMVFDQASKIGGMVDDPNVKTYYDLFSQMKKALATLQGHLVGVGRVLQNELDRVMNTGTAAPLDREAARRELLRIKVALQSALDAAK